MKKISYNYRWMGCILGCILIILGLTFSAGCKQVTDRTEEAVDRDASGNHMKSEMPEKPSEAMSAAFTGTVVETIDASRYTYVQVDTGEKRVWVATPTFDGAPGDEVSVPPGLPMADFQSKTLDRQFDMVYFVGAIHGKEETPVSPKIPELPKDHPAVGKSSELPKDHPSIAGQADAQMTHPPMGGPTDSPGIEIGSIEKAAGGQTVSEIITGRLTLAGKEVRVRAKVVKFTPDIMDKNWLHLRDGSGGEGTNDLIVTTDAAVAVGDVVVVNGVVSVDRDFGYGLKYPVIIENAEVARD